METKKINYKLFNLLMLTVIAYLLISTGDFWLWLLKKTFEVLTPFVLGFSFAYVFYPLLKWLEKKGIKKGVGITIILVLTISFVILIIQQLTPIIYEQIKGLISNTIKFIQDISIKYEIDLNYIQNTFSNINNIILDFGKFISESAIHMINMSIVIITNLVIAFSSGIYFLIDMDRIRKRVKEILIRRNIKTYYYIKSLDRQMKQYFIGLEKNIMVQLVEYILVFWLIGHPYYLILGILAAFTTIIPYFGGIVTNIIALVTAIVVDTKLFILTLIVSIILPNIDGYFWSPRIYGKTNNMHPILTIFGVVACSSIMGIIGIFIALPFTILIVQTFKYYKGDIKEINKKRRIKEV